GYFRTLGIAVKRGRVFDTRDRAGQPGVVVVGESLARRCWPGQDPIGKRLRLPLPPTEYDNRWLTVVGVVGDARYRELTATRLDLYMSSGQSDHRLQHLLLRTRADPASLVPAVRDVVRSLAPDQPAAGVVRMREAVAEVLAVPRFTARVSFALAGAATLLSLLGLYGVVAWSVAQRTREIGVRMSLGARASEIARMVVREGLTLAGAGALLGLVVAVALTRLIASLLFEVRPTDAATLASATVLLLLCAALACLLPALRAAAVQPAVALRRE
ncbi:MAG TPA: FtsX-like permease family protein, partial [Vicinamibacteria bacterium]|nr:FtsX-like permease family protein [Vicinamibacteria bacterium]